MWRPDFIAQLRQGSALDRQRSVECAPVAIAA
jgi:hypothetical protein